MLLSCLGMDGSYLLFVEERDCGGKTRNAQNGGNDQRDDVGIGGFQAVDKRISVGQTGGKICPDLGNDAYEVAPKYEAARSQKNPRPRLGDHREQHRQRDDAQPEDPPANRREKKAFRNGIVPEIGVIAVGDPEAKPVAQGPQKNHDKRLGQDHLVSAQPLGQGQQEGSRAILLGKDTALQQNENGERHGDILEKLDPGIQGGHRNYRNGHAALGQRIRQGLDVARDLQAKEEYFNTTRNAKVDKDDLFVMDIIRQEVKNEDSRLQRNIRR